MKRAIFMLSLFWSLALVSASNATAQNQKKESNSAAQKSGADTSKQKSAANQPAQKTSSAPGSAVPGAPSTAASRADNQGAKPLEPPKVRVLEINRINDLSVQVIVSLNEAAAKNANGLGGSLGLSAEFDNGQVASAIATVGSDTRRLTLALKPITPNPNGGSPITPNTIADNKAGSKGSGAPANSGGVKEKGSPTVVSLNATPRLTKVTAKLFFNVKSGNQNLVLTDELFRKF